MKKQVAYSDWATLARLVVAVSEYLKTKHKLDEVDQKLKALAESWLNLRIALRQERASKRQGGADSTTARYEVLRI